VILAKADGDELGGAALSVAYVSGVPILFMGTGEHIRDFEPFDPNESFLEKDYGYAARNGRIKTRC